MAYATYMGAHVKRKEDPRLITGSGAYVGDLKLPGMHYVAFVRSPYAHARIGEIDVSAALALDGVVAVVTGQDLAAHTEPMPFPFEVGSADGEANSARTHYALTTGKVLHMGECVAAVIASDAATAADAAEEVFVDWEPLPAVAGIEQALDPDAALLFDDMDSNVQEVWRRKVGDVDAAFAGAHKVVSQHITSQRLAAVPMEGRSIVAAPDPTTAGLTVWTSTQAPHLIRGQLAGVLRMSENAIRVIAPEVGGGFGVKIGIYPEEVVIASLAMRFQLPLSWVEGRSEHLLTTTHGRGQIADYALAVTEDGRITGMKMRVVADMGAYPIVLIIPELTGWMAVGVYDIPAFDIEIDCVFTNTTPIAAYRGAGRPEAAYYIERMVDLVANELGLDPTEVRRKNFIPPDAFPYDTGTTLTYDSGEYEKSLTKALDVSGYASLRQNRSNAAARTTATCSESALPATWRSAALVPTRAPKYASSPAEPSPSLQVSRRTVRGRRPPSPRSWPISWEQTTTRSSSSTATPPTPQWASARWAAAASPSAAPPSSAPQAKCATRPNRLPGTSSKPPPKTSS